MVPSAAADGSVFFASGVSTLPGFLFSISLIVPAYSSARYAYKIWLKWFPYCGVLTYVRIYLCPRELDSYDVQLDVIFFHI